MDVARRMDPALGGENVLIPNSAHGDWLSPEELRDLTPQTLIARMEGLRDIAAKNARKAEQLRRPADEVWSAIRKTGALYHFVPKRFGGLEFGLDTFVDVVLPIAEACTSTGWVTAFCMEHNYLVAHFPPEAQEEVFAKYPYVTAPGTLYPPGSAVPVEGGFRLSGRWKWGSGVMHADWAMVGGIVAGDNAGADLRFFLLPIRDVAVIDTWHVDGMAGTGSNDMVIQDAFVPDRRVLSIEDLRAGQGWGTKVHDGFLYKVSMPILSSLTAALPALGAARRAVHTFAERLSVGDPKLSERPAAHMRLGEARLDTMAAEAIMRDVARGAEAMAQAGRLLSLKQRVQERARICHALQLCRTATLRISEIAGSSAHALENPIQRALRDINVITTHALFEWDAVTEAYGRSLAGLAPNTMVDGR